MAQILTQQPEQYYFGKFPARGDFVRSSAGGALLNVFDQWISHALEMLVPDPRWKVEYDAASPMRFAFIGTGSSTVVAGVLTPSMDSSERRFPFVVATRFNVGNPIDFAALAPMRLTRYWQVAELTGSRARQAQPSDEFLASIDATPIGLVAEPDFDEVQFAAFMQQYTVAQIDAEIGAVYPGYSTRGSVLALGMLLQPLMTHGVAGLSKGLLLPLPVSVDLNAYMATYWLSLLSGFVQRHHVELSVMITRRQKRPVLLVGFAGASAEALVALISGSDEAAGYLVDLVATDWIEEYLDEDGGLRKLATYAENPQLSLTQLHVTFNEVFLGA